MSWHRSPFAVLLLLSSSALGAGGGYEPHNIDVRGAFTHPAAGFVMPESVGAFKRVAVTQYDEAATNISAAYNRLDERGELWPIVATLYVYPVRGSGDLDERFKASIEGLKQDHGGVEPDFREHVTLCGGRFAARYAAFGYPQLFAGATRPVRSYLVLYRYQDWWVKWRVTMLPPPNDEPIRAMVELTETLVPPGASCAVAPRATSGG